MPSPASRGPRDRKLYKLHRHEWAGVGGRWLVAIYTVKERKGGVAKEWRAPHWFAELRLWMGKSYVGVHSQNGIDRWDRPQFDKHCHTLAEAEEHYAYIKEKIAVAIAREAFGVGEEYEEG